MNRREVYENLFSAKALFIAGVIIMPALLFNPITEYRVIQFLFFWFLTWFSGRKVNFIFTILITLFIITFNQLVPYGRIIFSIGAFKITSGALEAGIHRAVTLQGLVMLSRVTIRQDLKIPGSFGQLLGESLNMFAAVMNRKYRITGKNLFKEIDSLMLELSGEPPTNLQPHAAEVRTKPAGFIIIAVLIVLSWLPWFFL